MRPALTVIIPFSERYQSPVDELIDERAELDSSLIKAQEATLFLGSIKELMAWRNGAQEDVMSIADRPVPNLPTALSHVKLKAIGKYEENRLGEHASIYIERDARKETVRGSSVFVWANGEQLRGTTHTTARIAEK